MATPKFTSHTTCINEFPKSDRTDLVSYEEDDPDTIRVLPRNDLKRRRCDSGVHFDESFERVLSNPTGLQEKTGAAAETGIKCLQFASGIMPVMSSPSADADSGRRLCKAINQPLTEADQMVLVPLATLKALQNEITELRNAFGFFKEDSRKFVSHDALNARLALIEVRTESSDGDDDDEDDDYCSPQALQKDKAARKVAVERIRRLAKHHNGKERAHLKFMADIVGVKHTSKLPIGHSIRKLVDPELQAYARQRLLEDYVAQLWRHTYEGSFAKPDFVALGVDVERLYGQDR